MSLQAPHLSIPSCELHSTYSQGREVYEICTSLIYAHVSLKGSHMRTSHHPKSPLLSACAHTHTHTHTHTLILEKSTRVLVESTTVAYKYDHLSLRIW